MTSHELEVVSMRSIMSAEAMRAQQMLEEGEIPESAISEHPGKGGKVFKYVKHTFATRQLNLALGPLWSYEVLSWMVYDDRSAVAQVRLTIHYPRNDGTLFPRVITELGGFKDEVGSMPKANMALAAVSRGLLRCMLRAFGFGQQFYESDEEMTPKDAWNVLHKFAVQNKIDSNELVQKMKEVGINRDNLIDRFEEAYAIAYGLTKKGDVEVGIPEGL